MSDMLCFHIHLVNAVVSLIDVGGSNVIWRYHRTELRSSQSDSKYGYEGLQENVRMTSVVQMRSGDTIGLN